MVCASLSAMRCNIEYLHLKWIGRRLCNRPIPVPEESYQGRERNIMRVCVCVCGVCVCGVCVCVWIVCVVCVVCVSLSAMRCNIEYLHLK